jgi:aromatic ring-opening dioxygenase catalytic subunit (LigB family)
MTMPTIQTPILYIPHGGGPLPLLGDPSHAALVRFLRSLGQEIAQPKAIAVISAHWEAVLPTVSSGVAPSMLFDYFGFPSQSYEYSYRAPGSADLAIDIVRLLAERGIAAALDDQRGFDHGTFVPLMLMYPQANIPVVQLSLVASLEPGMQMGMGQAIAELSQQGVLILGSGMSFHNMQSFMSGSASMPEQSSRFDDWLNAVVVGQEASSHDQHRQMLAWEEAPEARNCHPREEHLLPLHVCFGAAHQLGLQARNVFNDHLLGAKVSAFMWR